MGKSCEPNPATISFQNFSLVSLTHDKWHSKVKHKIHFQELLICCVILSSLSLLDHILKKQPFETDPCLLITVVNFISGRHSNIRCSQVSHFERKTASSYIIKMFLNNKPSLLIFLRLSLNISPNPSFPQSFVYWCGSL